MKSLTLQEVAALGIRRVEIVQAPGVSNLIVRCPQGRVFRLPTNEKLSITLDHYARMHGLEDSDGLIGLPLELVEQPDRRSRWPWKWRICKSLSEGSSV